MKNPDCFIYSQEDIGDFLPIPRLLVTHEGYRNLSSEAKIVYSLFLERMQTKGLLDEGNRNYIIYPTYELQKMVNISQIQLEKVLVELDGKDGYGLIVRVKQAYDLPPKIYLCNIHRIDEKPKKKVHQIEGKGKILQFAKVGV